MDNFESFGRENPKADILPVIVLFFAFCFGLIEESNASYSNPEPFVLMGYSMAVQPKSRLWYLMAICVLGVLAILIFFNSLPLHESPILFFSHWVVLGMAGLIVYLFHSLNQLLEKAEKKNIQLNAMVEFATVGILLSDDQGKILTVNKFTENLFGYSKEELVGQTVEKLIPNRFLKKNISERLSIFSSPKYSPILSDSDLYALRKDGTELPVGISLGHFMLEGQQAVVVFVNDFTERTKIKQRLILEKEVTQRLNNKLEAKVEERTKKMEEALLNLEKSNFKLRESEKKLQKALSKEKELGELKSRFVTMASHEFRTPLTTILSSLFLLENSKEEDQEKIRSFHFERIRKSAKNLVEILNDFLSLSKLEEGVIEPSYEPTNIPDLINDLLEGFQTVKKDQQVISYRHIGNNAWFSVDGKFLRNILVNLLSNAIKFSPKDGIIEVISRFEGNQIRIEVADQGIGIPEEERTHLFNRFFRAKNAQNIEGTGLGLNIVKKYIDLMNGSIELNSVLNQGTRFTLTLPNPTFEID